MNHTDAIGASYSYRGGSTNLNLRPTKSVSMTVSFPVSAKKNRPVTQQVDYFSFHFDEIDLHATWRKACHTAKKAKNWNIHIQGKRRGILFIK